MRMPVLEDRDCFLTRLKYSLEPAASARRRFDDFRRLHGRPEGALSGPTFRHGGFYIIHVGACRVPSPPPVWFAKAKLREDQIAFLEETIRSRQEQEKRAK